MKHVVLDLDDFSILNNHLYTLTKIKEHFPYFKFTAFMIPHDVPFERSTMRLMRDLELEKVQRCAKWIEFVPHGLFHFDREFENCDKHTMDMILDTMGIEFFNKDHLPFTKGFKAPYWLWNSEVVESLDDHGWWGAVDRNQPEMLRPKRFYQYNYSLEEPFWEAKEDVLKIHGHMDPPSLNNLEDNWLNLLKLPQDTSFHFASEFVENTYEDTRLS